MSQVENKLTSSIRMFNVEAEFSRKTRCKEDGNKTKNEIELKKKAAKTITI